MSYEITKIFLGNEIYQEKHLVAASATMDSIEVFYALENRCERNGTSCTVSSHVWYSDLRTYLVEQISQIAAGR